MADLYLMRIDLCKFEIQLQICIKSNTAEIQQLYVPIRFFQLSSINDSLLRYVRFYPVPRLLQRFRKSRIVSHRALYLQGLHCVSIALQYVNLVLVGVTVEVQVTFLALIEASFQKFHHNKILKQVATHPVKRQLFSTFYAKQTTRKPRVAEVHLRRFRQSFTAVLKVRRHQKHDV